MDKKIDFSKNLKLKQDLIDRLKALINLDLKMNEKYLGFNAVHKLIISAHKNLNIGGYLIDDYIGGKGQEDFQGEVIHYGSNLHPDWHAAHQYFKDVILLS